jgi:hypothetical protein
MVPARTSRPALARIVLVAVAALTLAGCGDDGPSTAPLGPTVDCVGVPVDHCRDGVAGALAAAGNAPVTSIMIRCSVPSCSAREGQMTVTVLFADGRQTTSGSGWATAAAGPVQIDPVELPVEPTCLGVALDQCEQLAQSFVEGTVSVEEDVVSIVVRCGAAKPCDAADGSGTTDVTLRDGTQRTSHWSYENAAP